MKPEWCDQNTWDTACMLVNSWCAEPHVHRAREDVAKALLEAEQRKQAEIDRLNAVIARMQQTMSSQAEQWTRSMSEAEQRGRREGMEEGAKVADSWEATSQRLALKAEPNSDRAIHHGVAADMANDIKCAIRAKMEEQP